MNESFQQAEERAQGYTKEYGILLNQKIGFGNDGVVWKTNRESVLKAAMRLEPYERERDVYRRLMDLELSQVHGFAIPRLLNYSNKYLVIEMELVIPPFVIDFGKAYLDQPPDYPAEALAEWWVEREELYEPHQWPLVRKVLATFAAHGIHYFDPQPGNIRFPPK